MFTLNPKNLGIAGGMVWGLAMMFTTWLCLLTGYGFVFLSIFVDLYPYYSISFLGSFFGLFWGFIDGFIGLWLFGWVYNFLEH